MVSAFLMASALSGGHAIAEDCPRPLDPMQAISEQVPNGLVHRRALEMTATRIVYADYVRSRSASDRVIDVGTGWMENRSDVRRRIRYHHQFPLDRHPMVLIGTVAGGATASWKFDPRIGCHSLDPEWTYHAIEGDGDRMVLRIEVTLDPGERAIYWWTLDLQITVAARLPADRDGDGDVDLEDLAIALVELGRGDPDEESEALRVLMQSLGPSTPDSIGRSRG